MAIVTKNSVGNWKICKMDNISMESETFKQTPRPLIIMPAWNEEEVIGGTIEELFRMMPEVDLA